MPKFANIEDSPHHLKLLNDYGKTAVTLSITLLSLSVAFFDKILKPPIGLFSLGLLILLWVSLLCVLILGLCIAALLTAVSSNYMKARGLAYPDALQTIQNGTSVKLGDPNETITVSDANTQGEIRDALKESTDKTRKAYSCARWSLFFIGFSAVLILAIGIHESFRLRQIVDGFSAVETSIDYVVKEYKLTGNNAQFRSMSYDEKKNAYTIEIVEKQSAATKQAPITKYEVTISGSTGGVTDSKAIP